ncbi:hypothetical protein [Paenibacillus sp. M2]
MRASMCNLLLTPVDLLFKLFGLLSPSSSHRPCWTVSLSPVEPKLRLLFL